MKRSEDYSQANDKVTEMSSLSAVTTKAVQDGYIENFKVQNNMLCTASGKCFSSADVRVVNYYRFEGDSDPGDNTILYVIDADSGTRGTLVDAYGAYADEKVNKFMAEVDGVHKK